MKTYRSLNSALRAYRKVEARYNRFLARLHRIAVANACPGDLFIGWDRPTLRSCRPDDFAALVAMESLLCTLRAWVRWFSPVAAPALEFA